MSELTPSDAKAIARFQVISAYLALDPPRGQRRKLLEQLASRVWRDDRGQPWTVSAETMRVWIRRYRRSGLQGLADKPRPQRGVQALTAEQIELVCKLKKEVPERSIERVIAIAEELGHVPKSVLRRSTVHRVLQARGLSRRPVGRAETHDLDRFEAAAPNDLWQSDMLVGPWLPDPQRPGKTRRAYLYAFLDDHSRLLLHGRFSFKGDLPALELVFRRSLQKYGVPKRVYYDNGQVYRSGHMKQIAAHIGVHRMIFTKPYRPQGHGKIEAFNRFCRSAFIAELAATQIATLDELNEAFNAWVDSHYNCRVHGDTGAEPMVRWRAGIDQVRYVDERVMRQAFLFKDSRKADKTGVFSLFGVRFQVGPELADRRFEVRYDPEQLDEVEVWRKGVFMQRSRPLEIEAWRRPKPKPPADEPVDEPKQHTPVGNWLGHLVEQQRVKKDGPPVARDLHAAVLAERRRVNHLVATQLRERLAPELFDEAEVVGFLAMYGPFSPDLAAEAIDELLESGRADAHVSVYLDAIRARCQAAAAAAANPSTTAPLGKGELS